MRQVPPTILIDADACPVKDEVYRVAERFRGKGVDVAVKVVSNAPILVPGADFIERVVVSAGPDAADDWIVEHADASSIVVTADIPLAARAIKAGAAVIAPNGKTFTEDSIGLVLAQRNLLDELRSAGSITGGPKPFAQKDRSAFLSALDRALRRAAKVPPA